MAPREGEKMVRWPTRAQMHLVEYLIPKGLTASIVVQIIPHLFPTGSSTGAHSRLAGFMVPYELEQWDHVQGRWGCLSWQGLVCFSFLFVSGNRILCAFGTFPWEEILGYITHHSFIRVLSVPVPAFIYDVPRKTLAEVLQFQPCCF